MILRRAGKLGAKNERRFLCAASNSPQLAIQLRLEQKNCLFFSSAQGNISTGLQQSKTQG